MSLYIFVFYFGRSILKWIDSIVALRFKNWIEEEWETQAIAIKNQVTLDALSLKYNRIHFLDPDVDNDTEISVPEVYRRTTLWLPN